MRRLREFVRRKKEGSPDSPERAGRAGFRERANRDMMRLTYGVVLAFVCLIAYEGWFLTVKREDTINNSYNARLDRFAERVRRGEILSADGAVLAETLTDENGAETRNYPYGPLFAHAVGYSARGETGLEDLCDFYLLTSHVNLLEQGVRLLSGEKEPGDRVVTTLDARLQQVASDALGDRRGAVVAVEPGTGRVRVMLSRPAFDPNRVAEDWEALNAPDSGSPLLNRATQGLYPPGSIFKTVTALEYYRENPGTWQEFRYDCDGSYEDGEYTIRCYHGSAHGAQSLAEAYANSCNGAFASLGKTLDPDRWKETAEELLFNRDLPFAIAYTSGSYRMDAQADPWEVLQTSIGQGRTQITPLHAALITSAIANGGVLMAPFLVDRVENAGGDRIRTFRPSGYGRLMTEEEAAFLAGLMRQAVESGTGSALRTDAYTAAGKTGSAEFSDSGGTHAWFTGFSTAENAGLAVAVLVEEGGSGGAAAAPIARKIFDAYFAG